MKTVRVQTSHPYDVLIGPELLPSLGTRIAALPGGTCRRVVVVTDESAQAPLSSALDSLHAAGLEADALSLEGGESFQTFSAVQQVLHRFAEHNLAGGDAAVALGGTAVCNVTGFASAVYLPGVQYIPVPTTLAAALERSSGALCRLHLPAEHHCVGLAQPPCLVLCDMDLLHKLDVHQLSEGAVLALQTACAVDTGLFELLETGELLPQLAEVIARCTTLQSAAKNPPAMDSEVLRFGGFLGRGIERLSRYKAAPGHAHAVGMCLTAEACVRRGVMSPVDAQRIRAAIAQFGLPTRTSYPLSDICRESLTGWQKDSIPLTILERIGKAAVLPVTRSAFRSLICS